MNLNIYESLLKNINNGKEMVLVTNYNLSSNKIKKNMYRFDELDGDILKYANIAKQNGGANNIKINEDENIFVEIFKKESRLIVFGAGHVGKHLCNFASKIGFNVTVIDDRAYFANRENFCENVNIICDLFENVFNILDINKEDYIVLVTRGHKYDKFCLEKILNLKDLKYIGMIGSKKRVKIMKEELISEGYSKEKLDNIYSPIGLNIGAVTPEEIAISILAELISIKRIGKLAIKNEPIKIGNSSELNKEVVERLSTIKDEKISIVTVLSTKGSTPRKAGSKMIVYNTGDIIGTIGGGCAEAQIIREAANIAGTNNFKIQTIDMTGKIAEDEGMVCGGIMTVFIEGII